MKFLLIAVFFLASCSSSRMIETSLYFGQAKASGGTVSPEEWTSFKNNHITRIFREGSTIISVQGQWFDPDKRTVITEPTYLVVYVYKPSSTTSKQIDSLRYLYKTLYDQQSVLRIDKKASVQF